MTFVFDLDDTLYLERDYVRSGFRAVSALFGARAEEVFGFLWDGFLAGVRGDAFDRLLDRYGSAFPGLDVAALVEVYRHHDPEIDLLPGYRDMLGEIRAAGCRLALISDGPLASQEAKVRALGLREAFDQIVLTDALGEGREFWKPHSRAFEQIELVGTAPFVWVADNPSKDFVAPLALGWRCLRARYRDGAYSGVDFTDPRVPEVDSARALQSWVGAALRERAKG